MILESIAAANTAYAIIRQCVQNGSELTSVGKSIGDFVNAKDAIQKAASKHGSNLDGSKSDLEEFLALENVKKQENELRSMMQLYGRAGMYDDYIRFCGEARRRRKAAAEKAKREHEELLNFWIQAGFVAAVLAIGVYALWLIALILMEANAQ